MTPKEAVIGLHEWYELFSKRGFGNQKVIKEFLEIANLIETLEKQVPRWISVEERLPEGGTHVLVAVKFNGVFSSGGYVCDAFYAGKFDIASEFGDELACDYCEEKDEYFLEEGWYEVIKNWDDYASVVIADTVTHWMPLPPIPRRNDDG